MQDNQALAQDQDREKELKERYKDTVRLPQTDFPMRGNLPEKEPGILERWEEIDLYGKQREQAESEGRAPFILHDGPPYANGNIHIGHALNKILKDVVMRAQRVGDRGQGKDTPYTPGWDCHGLPIEWKIEEKYRNEGKDKDDVPILQFRQECRDFAQKWVDIQREEFKRLGVTGDWDNPYLTMTHKAEAQIVREIHKFLTNGLLYKGAKPVMWSVVEKTALAEAEVEYKEHKSVTVWVKFPVIKTVDPRLEGAKIVIWTTTPWTLPSNRAIAYGEHIQYGLYDTGEEKLVLAQSLAADVKEKAGIENWTLEAELTAEDLAGAVCAHPLRGQGYEFDVPLLTGDFVTEDAGTGFVHIAPGHGADDFLLGQKEGLEITDNVADDGTFRDHVPLFAGLPVYNQKGEMDQGNFAVLGAFKDAGALLAKGSVRHEYPHSWRSKAPLIFRTTPQWFIGMDIKIKDCNKTLREQALDHIGQTQWVPEQGETRIRAMIENRPDWCISRQRAWGVPIALFISKETGAPLKDENVLKRIADIFEEDGSDAWWARDAQDFLGSDYKAEDYEQIFDIVDVWFESGSTHAFVLDQDQVPADLYLEGSDQHRGWFHSSLLESCGTRGHAPFRAVMTHGFILDEKGYKMSKSLGNVVAPQDVMNQYGADILRLWAILADYEEDVRIGTDVLKSTADIYRRFRNTLRFLLGNLADFSKDDMMDAADMPELERYVLHELAVKREEISVLWNAHQYGRAMKILHGFCNSFLSSFYFDIRKDALYCDAQDSMRRRACQTVLVHLFDAITSWLSPVLCFTSEEAWSHRPGDLFSTAVSVHLKNAPAIEEGWRNDGLTQKWQLITRIRDVVLGALEIKRADKTIGSSLEAAPTVIVGTPEIRDSVADIDLAEVCITSGISLKFGSADGDAFRLPDVQEIAVKFQRAEGQKCVRCWQILPSVDRDPAAPGLCPRCAEAVRAG